MIYSNFIAFYVIKSIATKRLEPPCTPHWIEPKPSRLVGKGFTQEHCLLLSTAMQQHLPEGSFAVCQWHTQIHN